MECINCKKEVSTFSFSKEIKCKSCGKRYVAKNLGIVSFFAFILFLIPLRFSIIGSDGYEWIFWAILLATSFFAFMATFVKYGPEDKSAADNK